MKRKISFQSLCNLFFVYLLALILAGSFAHQFLRADAPCDLCLLQRASMIGVMIALLLNLRFGIKVEHYALAIIFSLLGLCASMYQISLHLDPDIDLDTVPLFGHFLFVWSFWIFLASLTALSILLFLFGVLSKATLLPKGWIYSAFAIGGAVTFFCLLTAFPF